MLNNHPPVSKSTYLMLLVLLSVITGACSKQYTPAESPAVLQVFNGLDDNKRVLVNMSGKHPIAYHAAYPLTARNIAKFSSKQAIQPMAFYTATDTLPKDKPLWEDDLDLETGKIYSMFLFEGPTKAETIFLKENFPRDVTDSVTYLRFANLSSSGQPITANLAGNPNGSLISHLEPKSISPVVQLPINRSTFSYTFEVRDANTGALLATFSLTDLNKFDTRNLLFQTNWTLILTGKQGVTDVNRPQLTAMYHL